MACLLMHISAQFKSPSNSEEVKNQLADIIIVFIID